MNMSGEVADACFLQQCENNFVLLPNVIRMFNIKLYARYKDDLLIILGAGERRTKFIDCWLRHCRASEFTLEKWEASQFSLDFFDLTVFKVSGSDKLHYATKFKQSSSSIPLTQMSSHSTSIVRNWQRTEICRFAINSSRHVHHNETHDIFFATLREHYLNLRWLKDISEFDAFTEKEKPVIAMEMNVFDPITLTWWPAIPYHRFGNRFV